MIRCSYFGGMSNGFMLCKMDSKLSGLVAVGNKGDISFQLSPNQLKEKPNKGRKS